MRFNVKEIKELASQHQCEKEGNLFFRERQEGFFRKQEGLSSKNNLPPSQDQTLIYFKTDLYLNIRIYHRELRQGQFFVMFIIITYTETYNHYQHHYYYVIGSAIRHIRRLFVLSQIFA